MAPRIVTVAEVSETQFTQLFDQFEGDLEDIIEAAEDVIIGYLGYDPVASEKTEIVRISNENTIRLKNYPINSVSSVEVSLYPDGPWRAVATTGFYMNLDAGYIS